MIYGILVAGHVGGSLAALASGFSALYARSGSRIHKIAGKVYLFGWALLALAGALLGADDNRLSAFEVLNAVGFGCALLAYLVIVFRRRVGQRWLRLHMDYMLISMAGLWVATANQLFGNLAHALGLPYPFWFFVLLCLTPFVVLPRLGAFMARRYGLPAEPKQRRSEAAQAG